MVAILFGLSMPLLLTSTLVAERGARRDEAVTAIGSTWGGAQVLAGPVLSIPYECPPIVIDPKVHTQSCLARAFFLPESLEITGVIDPEVRRRSLFEAVVYRAQLKVTSRFKPNFAGISPAAVAVRWSEATLDVGLSEAKGVARRVQLTSGGEPSEFQPSGLDVGLFPPGMQAGAGLAKAEDVANRAFSFDIQVNGTRDLRFLGAAKETAITVSSSWRHPGRCCPRTCGPAVTGLG